MFYFSFIFGIISYYASQFNFLSISNYISNNISSLSKIIERVVKSRLTHHLSSNNFFNPNQSAYRKHHFTEIPLSFTYMIIRSMLYWLSENILSVSSRSLRTPQLSILLNLYRVKQLCYRGLGIVILSVRLSDIRVLCDKMKEYIADILIPLERVITRVFWYQQRLVGDVPFYLKFALKMTRPFEKRQTSTNIRI